MAWIVALALVAQGQAEEPTPEAFKSLLGTWIVNGAEKDGQPLDRLKGGTLVIKDQNFTIKTASGFELKGDTRLDPAKQPKRLDFVHQEGALRDKVWEGIYALDGDDLKICYDSNKGRPTEFATAQDSGFLLLVLKRQKK